MVNFKFPCDVGDCVYIVMDDMHLPAVREVFAIRISKNWDDEYEFRFSVRNARTKEVTCFYMDAFNKTVFVNKEDAMRAIKNRE